MTGGGRLVLPQDDSYVRHTLVKLLKPFFHVLLEREPQKFMCLFGLPQPQMFRENIGVVVEGTMTRNGYFESHRLMVSHNNQYKAPKSGHSMDRKELEKLMKTTEGLEEK